MAERFAGLSDSFGIDDDKVPSPVAGVSATTEAIKDRRAMRRLVNAGVLPPEQMPRAPRVLSAIRSAVDAPVELRVAAEAALALPSPADED